MTTARRASDDRGMTLIELLVGMGVMVTFMAIFTTAVVSMFSSSNKIQALENGATQLNTAFDRLDRQVRYATVIDQPIGPSTSPSVAFRTVDGPTSTTCTQLEIRTDSSGTAQQLVERTWPLTVNGNGSSTPGDPSPWHQLAAGITLVDQNPPFTVPTTSSSDVKVQQLQVRLAAVGGGGRSRTSSFTDVTFSALNSSTPASGAPACVEPGES